jgi:hypothetical protein
MAQPKGQPTTMKKTETRKETLEPLARDAGEGAGAAKRFEALVKRVAKTPSQPAKSSEEEPTEA